VKISLLDKDDSAETAFEGIVGQSSALRRVLQLVETVATGDSTVLLLGETGTGKELIARAIHYRSQRKSRAFAKLNCAAIPSGLLESELFGHERGAFTGAITQKTGRIEVADQGSLFLDEIGDIPLELQPKLLRVLQEREFERLGSTRTKKVDVRKPTLIEKIEIAVRQTGVDQRGSRIDDGAKVHGLPRSGHAGCHGVHYILFGIFSISH